VLRFTGRWMDMSAQLLCLAILLAVTNLSPRRGFAGDQPSHPPTSEADTPKKAETERPPFDLTYVPPASTGVIALRPNAIFHEPAMRPFARKADEELARLLKQLFKIPAVQLLPVEEVEQVIVPMYMRISPSKGAPKEVNNSITGFLIRASHDYDWRQLMRQLDPMPEEVLGKYPVPYRLYRLHLKGIPGLPAKAAFNYYIPDKRTLGLFFGEIHPSGDTPDKSFLFSWPWNAPQKVVHVL